MPKALAMLVNIEEENIVTFYLLEEKKRHTGDGNR
jgi:hypothetical protein